MPSITDSDKSLALQVFTKAPSLQPVKTRLAPALTPDQRIKLYCDLIGHTLNTCQTLANAHIQLWVTPKPDDFITAKAKEHGATVHFQHGKDLGDRMHHALNQGLKEFENVILIGCDCPSINPDYLQSTLTHLRQDPHQLQIGAADDGGYVMLGAARKVEIEAFTDIQWGSEFVLDQTISRMKELGRDYLIHPSLRDIDRPEDLEKLPKHLWPWDQAK